MRTVLALLLAYSVGTLVFCGAASLMATFHRRKRVRPSRLGVSCFLRDWAATTLLVAMFPLGIIQFGPRIGPTTSGRTPVLLVPGYLMNRSCFWFLRTYLGRRGWGWVWPVNNRPVSAPISEYARRLARQVERLKEATGAQAVDIVGHSMGGIVAAYYINELGGDAHVRRLVTLGTPWRGTGMAVFGPLRQASDLLPQSPVVERLRSPKVPTMAVWSRWDGLVQPPENALPEGASALELAYLGHMDMLVSARAFRVVADLLSAADMQETHAPAEPTDAAPPPDEPAP